MNIGIGKFLKNGLTAESIEGAFRRTVAAITSGWEVQHREDGTHKDVTADTLTIAEAETGSDGNWTGSLIPTTATQDVGGIVESAGGLALNRPIRNIRLSGDITWATFSTSEVLISDAVVLDSHSYTASPASSAFTFTLTQGVNTHTFTIGRGLIGLETNRAVICVGLSSSSAIEGTHLIIGDAVTAPGATAGKAKIYVDVADGDLKVVFGDGTVKTIVTDT